jgi:hypothetical protein
MVNLLNIAYLLMDDDLAALTTHTVAPAFCIGSHSMCARLASHSAQAGVPLDHVTITLRGNHWWDGVMVCEVSGLNCSPVWEQRH